MRVLIVDDHPVVVSGCKALLSAEPDMEVFDACDAESGLAAYGAQAPDVAVIDINLPGVSGFELATRVLAQDPAARIVMFSMNDDPAFAARAIKVGAKGYVAKNDDPSLFVAALRKVWAGGTYLPGDLAQKMAFAQFDKKLAQLSQRELEIVRLLAAGETMGAIADKLGVSYKTIANNCTALKTKLGARTSMDLMRAALEAQKS
ncbi:response regulator transcription factor [Rhodoblastus acidophilus]|uniref:Response regulator transcription factor n=1 Tax=Candidatus Rhodoblastus alkanivorans TaxID=2954117 RepID=A0ABS9Z3A7_9HYPH|nr:response regulator transcription factor [Candidatus Rhodoblastus alkanivorans]MCI4677403.1 response regulator transcription factor [Candidatus Rhodoblastus alkanivorans]MCI4682138.1 response regulator transcription factor [Candidatus Rhodoblastus alkanivorans]MDI4639440.1 response regulator transcription factor [Rhodoblastus acidophilus]